ncbi:hypothetical protein BZB76_5675 [Actinomadura pelletieri DSM 43383]|uniref:Uncharacterized protein n=1 Tax=Actinomadura pelletieri DSM 43383 TaxID=1120940 RepID=A0A495QH80_9ACTN|nr:hypothetical protein [Actinomadura pelletieri]RKS71188.1 hypothetical protein BZB76_5675 [Actinomadura pelletieri DSM 43383]
MLASPLVAGSVLADSTRLGDAYFMAIGPAVIFAVLIVWILITLMTARKPPPTRHRSSGLPHRGPVQGGVISGSPSQRTRRDPAPSETRREAMADISRAQEREAEERRPAKRHFGRRRPR